jgi:Tol biopolymer transport system component
MQTKINHLLGAALSLLVTFGFTHRAAAQEHMVFYAPAVATIVSQRTHTVSYQTNMQIFSMNVDGTAVKQLTTGNENANFPRWRPGQTHILFHRGGYIYVMDANGGGIFAVAADWGDVGSDWSPDGSMICYVARSPSPPGPLGLFIVSVDPSAKGNKKVGTPVCVSQGDFYGPAWSPDGTRIAFSDQLTGLQPPGPRLRVLDLATGIKTTLDLNHSLLPSWSSTGNRIAFVSGGDTGSYWQLYIANADFSGITQVTDYNISVLWPTWSPDDTQIAFRLGSGRPGPPPDGAAIYKLTLATGELTLLQEKGDHPDWRP